MRLWMAVALICLAGPVFGIEDSDGSLARLDAERRARLLNAMDLNLADGPSSRLRNVRLGKGRTVCGLINSKNRMGAYMGYLPFAYDMIEDKFMIPTAASGDEEERNRSWIIAYC